MAIGAMVSFFSLTLSCLNAGSRIIFSMAHHSVFPKQLGQVHPTNRTPYVAISSYILLILAVPCVLEIFTNPLTTFGDGGTLAAFGFLTAYYLITIAAPVYLKKRGELKAGQRGGGGDRLRGPRGTDDRELRTRCRHSRSASSPTSSWPGCWSEAPGSMR